jgi:hypothetical protein
LLWWPPHAATSLRAAALPCAAILINAAAVAGAIAPPAPRFLPCIRYYTVGL